MLRDVLWWDWEEDGLVVLRGRRRNIGSGRSKYFFVFLSKVDVGFSMPLEPNTV
jgi:hypothetical protein